MTVPPTQVLHPAGNDLRAIALFKLAEATLLGIVGLGVLRLINADVAAVAASWVHRLHLDPNLTLVHALLSRLTGLNRRTLLDVGLGSLAYAALRVVEGVGLWRQQRWAEYLTVVATAALLPLEIYELALHLSLMRLVVLLVNGLLVGYLIVRLRRR